MNREAFWAVLDKFGHVQLAGLVSEEQRFGGPIGRIDVPLPDGTLQTQYFASGAVYGLTPCSEDHARELMRRKLARPVYALPSSAYEEDSAFEFDDDDPSEEEEEEGGEVFTGAPAQVATLEATLNGQTRKLAEAYWEDVNNKTQEAHEGAGAAWQEAEDGLHAGDFITEGPPPALDTKVRVRRDNWCWRGRVVRVEPMPSSTLWRVTIKAEDKGCDIPF